MRTASKQWEAIAKSALRRQWISVEHFADNTAKRVGLFGLLIVAVIALRTINLTALPFWLDEAYSAFGADQGFAFIWNILPTYETHPPFYTAILHSWTLAFGNSLIAFRSVGVAAAVLTALVIVAASRRLAAHLEKPWMTITIGTLALYAVLPALVGAARTVRPYNLMMLVNALGILAILYIARATRDQRLPSNAAWLGYFVCQSLLFWLHNLGALYVAALGLALIIAAGWRALFIAQWRIFLGGHVIVAAIALPALSILFDQAPTWTQSTWLRFDPSQIMDGLSLTFGLPGIFGFIAVTIIVFASFIDRTPHQKRVLTALLVAALIPTVFAFLLSLLIAPVYLPRTLVASAIPLIFLIAAGLDRNRITVLVFMMLVMLMGIQSTQITQAGPQEDWYKAVAWLEQRIKPGDQIYAYPNEGALPLRYAMRDRNVSMPVRSIPSEIPARDPQGWYPTGSRGVQSLPANRLKEIATDPLSRETPTIWLLRLKPTLHDDNEIFVRILSETRKRSDQFSDNDINIIGLTRAVPEAAKAKP
jgi:mannosyltransferase